MKKPKKTKLVLALLFAIVFGFIIKRVFVGYRYSGSAQTIADIKELDIVGFHKVLGANQLEVGPVEYHVRKGYVGRGYIDIFLKFRTSKAEFIEMLLCGLPYEQVIEGQWWDGQKNSHSGYVKKIEHLNDGVPSQIKQMIVYYLPKRHLVIDNNDFFGLRTLETSSRFTLLQAIFDIESSMVLILIKSQDNSYD